MFIFYDNHDKDNLPISRFVNEGLLNSDCTFHDRLQVENDKNVSKEDLEDMGTSPIVPTGRGGT
jgi:hypothetical protein